jgi:hypothetical protein
MTYSRPQTSTVGAFNTPARPNEPTAAPRQVVNALPSGGLRVVDFGGIRSEAAELRGFFDSVLQVAPKLIENYSIKQANRQVGELLDNVDLQGALRSNDQATLGMVKRLSPRAQTQLQEGLAATASDEYTKSYARNAANESLLLNPKGDTETDEQYNGRMTQGRVNVRQKALKESGILNTDPQARGKFAVQVQAGESMVMDGVRKAQDAEYNKAYDAQQASIYGFSLKGYADRRNGLLSQMQQADPKGQEAALAQMQNNRRVGITFYNENIDKATPTRIAGMMLTGVKSKFQELMSSELYQEASDVLGFFETVISIPIKTPAGGDLYDIPVTENGMSLKDVANSLRSQLRPEMERQQAQENYNDIRPLLPGMMKNDPASWQRFDQMLPNLARTPEQLGQLLSVRGQFKGISKETTPAQESRMLEIKLAQTKDGADIGRLNRVIAADPTLTPQQKLGLLEDEKAAKDPIMSSTQRAREYNSPQLAASTQSLAIALIKKNPNLDAKEAVRQASNYLTITATQNTETILKRRAESGQPVTPEVANDVFRNELDAARAGEFKRLKLPSPEKVSVQQERVQELNYVQQKLRQNNGRGVTLDAFPPSVIDAAKRNSVPTNDLREMTKFMLKRMRETPGDGGKGLLFPDPGKEWRNMIERAKPGADLQSTGPTTADKIASVISRYVFGNDTTPASGPEKKGGAGSQTGPLQMAARIGNGLLSGAMNVIAPPAMAAQGPMYLQNAERMPQLALAYRGSNQPRNKPMSLREGPLPQIAANAPVQPLPLAIASDKHPFFIAIGLNEGTRTANGGYTKSYFGHKDPGDGNTNVGTVSGGGARGGGGSPQVVDRMWAGKLTQQAMAIAPVLVTNGIPRNTAGFHRVVFNYLDLMVQAPAAARDFIQKLPQMKKAGLTIEAIAKARTDSFYYPDGRWGGVWPYPRMLQDQRSRAGTFDYKKRLGAGEIPPGKR